MLTQYGYSDSVRRLACFALWPFLSLEASHLLIASLVAWERLISSSAQASIRGLPGLAGGSGGSKGVAEEIASVISN
jgi:hypothetical protein